MEMKIHFMWVGQGDCTIIETNAGQPDGLIIMIDCGSVSGLDRVFNRNILPKLNEIFATHRTVPKSNIDYLFLTHKDVDHINMVSKLLDATQITAITNVYYGGNIDGYRDQQVMVYNPADKTYEQNAKITNLHNLQTCYLSVPNIGRPIINLPQFKLWILSANFPFHRDPQADMTGFKQNVNTKAALARQSGFGPKRQKNSFNVNGNSIVILIEYDNQLRAMFMGDALNYQQQVILNEFINRGQLNAGQANIFKMSHHGSLKDFNPNFTNGMVKPKQVICSAGIKGHKHPSMYAIDQIQIPPAEYDHQPQHWSTFCEDLEYVRQLTIRKADRDKNVSATYDYYQHQDPIYSTMISFKPATAGTKRGKGTNMELHGVNWVLTANSGTDYNFNQYNEKINEALKLSSTGDTKFSATKRRKRRRRGW